MQISIVAVGRMKNGPERELVTRYLDRATATGKQLGFGKIAVTELTESRASSAKARKAEEAKAIKAALPDRATLIILDEHGRQQTSTGLANKFGAWRDDGKKDICFVIGGADGLDQSLIQNADLTLAFSTLTWPHQLVRIMLAEQLYRIVTILIGHPYHRGE